MSRTFLIRSHFLFVLLTMTMVPPLVDAGDISKWFKWILFQNRPFHWVPWLQTVSLLPRGSPSWSDPPRLPSSVQQGGFKQRPRQKNGVPFTENRQVFWQPVNEPDSLQNSIPNVYKLSSSIFPCSSVRHATVTFPFVSTKCHIWPYKPYILLRIWLRQNVIDVMTWQ